jgi:O-antigen ligase
VRETIAGYGILTLSVLLAVVLLLLEKAPPIAAGLMLLSALVAVDWQRLAASLRAQPIFSILALFLLWMLLSSTWSIAGTEGLERGVRIALMIGAAALLPAAFAALPVTSQALARTGIIASFLLMIGLLFVETVFGMPILRAARYLFNAEVYGLVIPPLAAQEPGLRYSTDSYLANRLTHLASIIGIVLLPFAGWLWQSGRRIGALAVLAAGLVAVILSPAQTPILAITAGILVAGLTAIPASAHSRVTAPVLAALLAIAVVAAPWLAEQLYAIAGDGLRNADPSVIHRLAIWDNAAALIAHEPVMGYGIEASRVIGRGGADLPVLGADSSIRFEALPLHPHNAAIQIWLELGGIGALLYALMLFVLTQKIWRMAHGPLLRASFMGGWAAAVAMLHLSYGVWQFWWIATLGMIAAMLFVLATREGPR